MRPWPEDQIPLKLGICRGEYHAKEKTEGMGLALPTDGSGMVKG